MSASSKTDPRNLKEAELRIAGCFATGGKLLGLAGLGLSALPESVRKLTRLETLDIRGNAIRQLPAWISELAALRELHWYENGPVHLPEALGKLPRLEFLHLGDDDAITGLEVLPRLAALRRLLLVDMSLTAVPPVLRGLDRLRELWLAGNALTKLPEWAGEWTGLVELHIGGNRLTDLPDSLAALTRLRDIDISGNQFTSLPPVLHRLPALERLYVRGNSKLPIPESILDTQDAKKILAYDRRLQDEQGERPLNEAKMILVGRGAVGKTTLVHQLVHGKWVQKHKTKGIKVSDWQVKDGKGSITTHVWDFGGQEIMHGTHQFFLTERALYLLVLAGREDREDDDALYWLKMIGAFGSDSPVLVVLNKIKEHRFEVDEEALREKYPNIVGFYETDCKKNLGIRKLRQAVETHLRGMEDVKKVFPAAWFRIKAQLPTRAKNFISFDAFRAVCAELGEKDRKEQEHLAQFLHILGIALNYRDDARLQETSVLNPHWVTGGIYALINDDKIMERRGVLRRTDLKRVLKAADYPEEKHDFLLLLMKKFELCFPLDDDGKEWLVPELLGKKGPKLGPEFDPKTALCFEYHYESLLPHGLIPRFISRAYTRIVDGLHWRTGVVVVWGGAKALVRADADKKRVEVRLCGEVDACQEALELVRGHFDVIHGNFKNIGVREVVREPGRPEVAVAVARLAKAVSQNKKWVIVEVDGDDVELFVMNLTRRFFGMKPGIGGGTIRSITGGSR